MIFNGHPLDFILAILDTNFGQDFSEGFLLGTPVAPTFTVEQHPRFGRGPYRG
jgi:hypothetical protein